MANAKSEKFYRAGLGKKKEGSMWQVSSTTQGALVPGMAQPFCCVPRRRRTLPPMPLSATRAATMLLFAACRACASRWLPTR